MTRGLNGEYRDEDDVFIQLERQGIYTATRYETLEMINS